MFKETTMTTKHTCGGPVFCKKTPGCARCDELLAGAPAVQWSGAKRKEEERRFYSALKAHDCKRSGCMVVCTFGDW